jgi:methionine transaminase
MAAEHGAINLSQGFPDFPVSHTLVELIHKYMLEGHNQYAPMAGVLPLRNIIADAVHKTFARETDPETEVTVTAGATEALFSSIAALVNPGDEVILFDPSYDSYDPSIRLNGGVPVHINLKPPHFSIPWSEVEERITPRTRMIMINTPHNPTGSVLYEADLKELERLALKHGLIVISDEVYEKIMFDDCVHHSVLRYPALRAQSVAVFSFGKTFHATGWKVGYAIASGPLTKEIRKAHQFITFSVNTPVQLALAEYMTDPENYLQLGKFYQQKKEFFLEQLKGSSFEPLPCFGSYFQLVSYSSRKSDVEMAHWMTQTQKVAPIPVSTFYADKTDNHLLRFCFAKRDETLRKAGEILKRL